MKNVEVEAISFLSFAYSSQSMILLYYYHVTQPLNCIHSLLENSFEEEIETIYSKRKRTNSIECIPAIITSSITTSS